MTPQHEAQPEALDVDGFLLADSGCRLIGKATRAENGFYHVLADVDGALCRIEIRVTFPKSAAP